MTKLIKNVFTVLATSGVAGVYSLRGQAGITDIITAEDSDDASVQSSDEDARMDVKIQVAIYPTRCLTYMSVRLIDGRHPDDKPKEYVFCDQGVSLIKNNYTVPTNIIKIPSCGFGFEDIQNILYEMAKWPEWQGDRYDEITNNSMDFAYAFLEQLELTAKEAHTLDAKTTQQLQTNRREVEGYFDFKVQVTIYPLPRLGERFPHMGVRIVRGKKRKEWAFDLPGIFADRPKETENRFGAPTKTVDIPTCGLHPWEVEEIIDDMALWPEFQEGFYHFLMHNCQDFAYTFVVQLEKLMKDKNVDADVIKQVQEKRREIEHAKAATASLGKGWLWGGLRRGQDVVTGIRPKCCEQTGCTNTLSIGCNHTCRACQKKVCADCSERGPKGTFRIVSKQSGASHEIVVKNPTYLCKCCRKKCDEDNARVHPVTLDKLNQI